MFLYNQKKKSQNKLVAHADKSLKEPPGFSVLNLLTGSSIRNGLRKQNSALRRLQKPVIWKTSGDKDTCSWDTYLFSSFSSLQLNNSRYRFRNTLQQREKAIIYNITVVWALIHNFKKANKWLTLYSFHLLSFQTEQFFLHLLLQPFQKFPEASRSRLNSVGENRL